MTKNIFNRFKLLRGIVTIWHSRHAEKKVNLLGFIVLSTAIVLYGNEGSGQSDVDKETVSLKKGGYRQGIIKFSIEKNRNSVRFQIGNYIPTSNR